jgi:two-component system, response regulator
MHEYDAVDILLVEDGDADAEMTLRALRKGKLVNKVLRVRDGVEALEFVGRKGAFEGRDSGMPRLIMLDVNMPRLGGIEVLRQLKGGETTKRIPVVMLTSSAEDRDRIESYDLGVNSYLVKPVEIEAFTEMIIHAGMYWIVMNRIAP